MLLSLGFVIRTEWILTIGLLWVSDDLGGTECWAQCLVYIQQSKMSALPPLLSPDFACQAPMPSSLQFSLEHSEAVIHNPSPTQAVSTSWYAVSLCPDPSERLLLIPTSPQSTQPFLCLFALSCLLRVDVISLTQTSGSASLQLALCLHYKNA